MKKVILFSVLLIAGLIGSQLLPPMFGESWKPAAWWIQALTMTALSFIMIHVGYEFEIDKSRLRSYGWDYVVAMTAAAFPWLFVAAYFVLVMMPSQLWGNPEAWKESLLAGRFAAPTSAGILFAMLAAAGLSATWLYQKARVLAIFDDLDTVLLMIPLKMLMVGIAWQLGAVVLVMFVFLWIAWRWLHQVRLPVSWPWVLGYSAVIAAASEALYGISKIVDEDIPIHIEVLLPAFALGCILRRPEGSDPHKDDSRIGHQDGPESPEEQKISTIVAGVFMVLVGLSMPAIAESADAPAAQAASARVSATISSPGWLVLAGHVLLVTLLANLGKMFPVLCYRREVGIRERLAVCIGMWPRGEVGAGVLVVSLSYGIGGPIVTVAVLSLALNLLLTGFFIVMAKRLIAEPAPGARGSRG